MALLVMMLLPIWGDRMPGPMPTGKEGMPGIYAYEAPKDKKNGCAVVVCPGGGYGFLAMDHEGKQVANFLNQHGVTVFVLKYRIADKNLKGPIEPAPMLDVQRAIRWARFKSKDYGIDPKRIGVMGFSAGGHLASTAATHFDSGNKEAKDPIDQVSSRPDFAILAYPVISMGPVTHGGSRTNLIGNKPDTKLVEFYSNEKQVTKDTPPTFLVHTEEDKAVKVDNSKLFKEACEKHGVPVQLVTYEKGQHGLGLGNTVKDLPFSKWPDELIKWMNSRKLLDK
ncbi:alpha/beta hydrolase [Telmatocola sphagniphila]|uniref:Alpha/beta hydrolase n=1 Tax=Telmatocola sphagniphila TaxID=1123043 RepID=A0A8E6B8A3_9BACT|nr:alpha/beta hydrolase [Telmatocola sphagniphila]QVL33329.1 alpha/beta hydrolase [Telmatocola sphagniphila]